AARRHRMIERRAKDGAIFVVVVVGMLEHPLLEEILIADRELLHLDRAPLAGLEHVAAELSARLLHERRAIVAKRVEIEMPVEIRGRERRAVLPADAALPFDRLGGGNELDLQIVVDDLDVVRRAVAGERELDSRRRSQ